jgi:hypothetical protein
VVGGIKIVHFSFDVGKISAILRAGGPAESQLWWQDTACKFSVVGGITIVHFSSDVGKISAII